MHKLKIRKIGNSLGVTIPREVLSALKLDEGDEIILTETTEGYAVTAYEADFEEAIKIFEEGSKRYRNALRELAK